MSAGPPCRVREVIGSQSLVICEGKYSGGRANSRVLYGPAKAVRYGQRIQFQGYILCTPVLFVLGLCSYMLMAR